MAQYYIQLFGRGSMELLWFPPAEMDVSGVDDSPLGTNCTCTQVAPSAK